MSTKVTKITKGPGKYFLFDSFKYSHGEDSKILVSFRLDNGQILKGTIISLSHEDGSGHSFMVTLKLHRESGSVKIYYNSKLRTGVIMKLIP